MDMKFPIHTTPENKYTMLLEVLKLVSPFHILRPRERQVYAELLYYNDKYKDLKPEDRNRLIFDYATREDIAQKYGISKDVVYNIMKELKQKNVITGKEISPKWLLPEINSVTFVFKCRQ